MVALSHDAAPAISTYTIELRGPRGPRKEQRVGGRKCQNAAVKPRVWTLKPGSLALHKVQTGSLCQGGTQISETRSNHLAFASCLD